MFSDLKIKMDADGIFDFELTPYGDLALTSTFESLVYASLFTDARVSDSELAFKQQQRGWWGNLYNQNQDRQLGSKIWFYLQSRNVANVENIIKNETYDALKWLIEDRYLKDIKISTIRTFRNLKLDIQLITITNNIENYYFQVWEDFGE